MNSKYIYTYVRTSRPCLSEIARGNENFKRSPDIKYQGFQDRCPPPLTRFRVRDRTRIELVVLVLVVVLVAVVGKSMCARVCVCVPRRAFGILATLRAALSRTGRRGPRAESRRNIMGARRSLTWFAATSNCVSETLLLLIPHRQR